MSGWGAIYANTVYALQTQTSTLVQLQSQISSGLRVARASDDPGDAVKIMDYRRRGASLDTYLSNLATASTTLEGSLTAMQSISTSLIRVRELLTQATSAIYSQANRAALAEEVNTLLEQAVSLANTSSLGQYAFSGQNVTAVPYLAQRNNGVIERVTYAGSYERMYVPVSSRTNVESQLVGDEVFRVSDPETPLFYGPTGAAPGTSPSTVRGDLWLSVTDGGTTSYDGGVLAPGSSQDQDTIIGAHTIEVDGAGMTVSLDGGPAVSFTGAENDLLVTNSNGETVNVDMTGWAGGSGSWQVSRSVELSLDDGATTTTITDFSQETAVIAPSGGVLIVDPSGINSVGVDAVTVPGSYDLFATLINIRDLLANTRDLSSEDQQELLQQANSSLATVTDNLAQKMAGVGSRIQALDQLKQTLETSRGHASDQAAMLQDADVVDVATRLAKSQNLYEMTLTSASKLLSISLLDFIM